MEDKKGFVLYADLMHTINKMPSDKAGDLFKHILKYVNDENPVTDDLIVQLTFEPIKQQLKRDLEKWQEKKGKQSEKGREGNLKRWNLDLYEKVKEEKITLEEAEEIAKHRKTSPPDKTVSPPIANVAVNDNVNVTVNDNVKDINKELKFFSQEVCFVYDAIIDLFPDNTKPKTDKQKNDWREEIRKLIDLDLYGTDELIEIITRARRDEFWQTNFQSIKKLRQKNKEQIKYIDYFKNKFYGKSNRNIEEEFITSIIEQGGNF